MNSLRNLKGQTLAYMFGGTVLFGALISGVLTRDKRWLSWHFSRLGEGGTLSAEIFNVSIILASLILLRIAYLEKDYLVKHKSTNYSNINLMFVMSLCMFALAIFPFDMEPILHDVAGYTMLLSSLYLCYVSPDLLNYRESSYVRYTHFVLLLSFLLYAAFFVSHWLSLLFVESILFIAIYVWLVKFIEVIEKK